MKNTILKFVNKPSANILSSQTLYESAFYLMNLNQRSESKISEVIDKIVDTQLPDGGFDIGYDFQFGPNLSKSNAKEGTSPELLSLTALGMYTDLYGERETVIHAIKLAVDWVLARIVYVGDGVAIPYAPDSFRGIHITNATSFCISALAYALAHADESRKVQIEEVIVGMYKFMHSQLVIKGNEGYWPYFYQDAKGEEAKLINDKIDNYHIAQQLYHHCLAQKKVPNDFNIETINLVSNYLLKLINDEGYLPYTFLKDRVSDKVHMWGFAALIPAFVEIYLITGNVKAKESALKVANYIMKFSALDEHFSPIILNSNKTIFDSNFYPRSDAWVIHSLSELEKLNMYDDNISDLCGKCYAKIQHQNFLGLENHVVTFRMRVFAKIVRFIIK